jgi:hypothetical protein
VPKKLNIKQVTLKTVTITAKSQTLAMKFPFTTRLAESLGWVAELPEMTGSWSPDAPHNRVEVRTIEFRPTDESQMHRSFQLECHGFMENFAVIRKAAKGKDSKRAALKKTDVTCTVAFMDENGAGLLTNYMRAIPSSNITVSYDPTPVQDTLDPVDDSQPPLPNAEVLQPDPLADDEPAVTIIEVGDPGFQGAVDNMARAFAEAEQLPDDPDFREPDEPSDEATEGDGTESTEAPAPDAPVKRGRGRPRKNV